MFKKKKKIKKQKSKKGAKMNQKARKSACRQISFIITHFSNEDAKIVNFRNLTQLKAVRCDQGKKRVNREKDAEQPDPNCEHLNDEQIWKIDENPHYNFNVINLSQLIETDSQNSKVAQNNGSLNPIYQNGIFEIQDLDFSQSEVSFEEDSIMFDEWTVDGQF